MILMIKPEHTVLTEIMTRKVVTLDISERVEEALRLMVKFDVGSVVVTDKDKPVGIVTERDVTRASLRETVCLGCLYAVSCQGQSKQSAQTWKFGVHSSSC